MFLDCFGCDVDYSLGNNFADFASQFSKDSRYRTELYKLRRKFMSHADGLIHADLHTSNILASRDKMKIIDMEFAFMGPFGYDLGYLVGNILYLPNIYEDIYFMLGKKCEGKIPRTAGAVTKHFTGSYGGHAGICQHGELVPLCK